MLGRLGRQVIRSFDALLRRAYGIREFADDPECILRLGPGRCRKTIRLSDGTVLRPGDPLLELHLWNEHLPPIPPGGHTMAWAARFLHLMRRSLALLADRVLGDSLYADIRALHGILPIPSSEVLPRWERGLRHLGFEVVRPQTGPWHRFAAFWENLYTLAIIWAFNPPSLRRRRFGRMVRCHVWLTRKTLAALASKPGREPEEAKASPSS
ncbi:MAG: YkoP family protein [Chloroflexia bacterium]